MKRMSTTNANHASIFGAGYLEHVLVASQFVMLLHEGFIDEFLNVRIGTAGAEDIPQADFRVAKQTHLEIAVGSYSDAVAPRAEVVRHGSDKADAALVRRDVIVFRGVMLVRVDSLQVWVVAR